MKRALTSKAAVWVARVLLGATFIFSGWSKCIDPWGFVYKIEDYLNAWHMAGVFPREIVLVAASALSLTELLVGMMLATGCLRRTSAAASAAIMCVMLPLTAYIAIANPVPDCGCFGDVLVISNLATFIKNLVLTAVAMYLLRFNTRATCGIRPSLQWIAGALTLVYGLVLVVFGWNVQPLVDFRSLPVGADVSQLYEQDDPGEVCFVYRKDGLEEDFPLDSLPDSTWTFVETVETLDGYMPALAVFDNEGYEINAEVFANHPDMLVITVPEPSYDYLARSRFANELAAWADTQGIYTVGLVGAAGDAFNRWKSIARPRFDVYPSSDVELKRLVRGSMGLVWIRDGHVALKRNFGTLDPDLLSRPEPLASLRVMSDGRVAAWLSLALAGGIFLLFVMGKTLGRKPNPVRRVIKKTHTSEPDRK